jgi:hypothetical protein
MRNEFDCPISYYKYPVRDGKASGYYHYTVEGFSFWKAILWHYSSWLYIPKELEEVIEPETC